MSSNKSISKHESLEFILGEPIESFPPNVRPSKLHVLKLWMFKYDQNRGSKFRFTPTEKGKVLKEIVSDLISVWKSHDESAKTIQELSIRNKIQEEIIKIEPLAKHQHRKDMSKEANIIWYKEVMENLNRLFNIAAPISPETIILQQASTSNQTQYRVGTLDLLALI